MAALETNVMVVIVNWERPNDTLECIRSVNRSNTPEIPIIVIDNGSKDDSVERISNACPNVTLIVLPRNLGFAGGYNAGIERALKTNATAILLLNNDTTLNLRRLKP